MFAPVRHLKNTNNQDFFQLGIDQSAESFLHTKSYQCQLNLNTKQFAIYMDSQDPLAYIRQEFFYPKMDRLPNGL